MENYARNLKVATNKAANICGVDAANVRAFYRKINEAPKGVKRATIIAHRIMSNCAKSAVPVKA